MEPLFLIRETSFVLNVVEPTHRFQSSSEIVGTASEETADKFTAWIVLLVNIPITGADNYPRHKEQNSIEGRSSGSVCQQGSNTDQMLPLTSGYASCFGRQPFVTAWITGMSYTNWKNGTRPVSI
jgi:hypothetical protein